MEKIDLIKQNVIEISAEDTGLSEVSELHNSSPWRSSPEDAKVFKAVDRPSEDQAVFEYQKVLQERDDLVNPLFVLRQNEIKEWARIFRRFGRNQQHVARILTDAWQKALSKKENDLSLSFPILLTTSWRSVIQKLHSKCKSSKVIDDDEYPSVDLLPAEDQLFKQYDKLTLKLNQMLGELYALREQTLRIWARRYHYLSSSEEDMMAELRVIWMKCINEYEYEPRQRLVKTKRGHVVHSADGETKHRFKRTPFNTYSMSSFRNYIVNQIKKKYKCKKRLDENQVPYEQTMISLDHEYDDSDGEGACLHEVIPGSINFENHSLAVELQVEKIAKVLTGEVDPEIQYALEQLAYDPHVKTLEVACRLRKGVLPVCAADRDFISSCQMSNDKSWVDRLTELLNMTGRYESGFSITNAQVLDKSIMYEVKVRDNKLLQRVKRAIKASNIEKQTV